MNPFEFKPILWTIIFLVEGLSPVVGLIIIAFEVDVKKWLLTFIKNMLTIIGTTYMLLGIMNSNLFPDKEQLILYSVSICLFLHYLQIKNPDKTAKVLGIVLIVTHLFNQYWEIPLFILAHLGIPPFEYHGSIDQIYLLLVFYVALRFANIKIAKKDIVLLSIPLLTTTLAFVSNPVAFQYVTPLWFLVRCLSCFCLGKFFVERSSL